MSGKLVPLENLEILQGADWNIVLELCDGEDNVLDLTGTSYKMQIRRYYDRDVEIELSSDNGRININTPISGSIELVLTNQQTSAFDFIDAYYDIEMTDSQGKITRLLEGKIHVNKEITR